MLGRTGPPLLSLLVHTDGVVVGDGDGVGGGLVNGGSSGGISHPVLGQPV